MAKQFVQSKVWLSKSHPNIAQERQLVTALEVLFREVGNKKIDWATFRLEHEMIGSHHPEDIAAGLGFSVIVEDGKNDSTDSTTQ